MLITRSLLNSQLDPLVSTAEAGIALAWLRSDIGIAGTVDMIYSGDIPATSNLSKRTVYAPRKALEVMWAMRHLDAPSDDFPYVVSPVDAPDGISTGLMGGIGRYDCIGVSGFEDQRADILLAATLLYWIEYNTDKSHQQHMYLHHTGRRTKSLAEFTESTRGYGARRDVSDHLRWYTPSGWTMERYFEVQHFEGTPALQDQSVHADFSFPTADEALAFLKYLGQATGTQPKLFTDADQKYDPLGAVWVPMTGFTKFGVMARANDWDPVATV